MTSLAITEWEKDSFEGDDIERWYAEIIGGTATLASLALTRDVSGNEWLYQLQVEYGDASTVETFSVMNPRDARDIAGGLAKRFVMAVDKTI